MKRGLDLSSGDVLQEVELKIPAGDQSVFFAIPKVTVRRVQKENDYEKSLIGMEFTNIADPTRKDILAYVLRTQRELIRKIGR